MSPRPNRDILDRVARHAEVDFFQKMPDFQMGSSIQQKAEIHAENDMSRIGVDTASSPGQPLPHALQEIRESVANHANNDMANIGVNIVDRPDSPAPAGKPSIGERIGAWVENNYAKLPTGGSEIAAMFREGLKDVRQTMNEVFFGKGEHAPELGTPYNPTQHEAYEDRHDAQPSRSNAFEPSARPGPAPEQSRGRSR